MLVNPTPIRLATARDVNVHLDRWATDRLTDPDQWRTVLDVTRDWSDYSARNQLLLASYGATGPVAGLETWRLVPARDAGTCAVRAGEHALLVRVPVTTTAGEPDPHLGGARPTAAAVQGWEWRGVFSVDQLARRPDPAAIAPPHRAETVDEASLVDAASAVARRTHRGRLPDGDDPFAVLVAAVGRMPRTTSRPAPSGALAEQAAGLALARVGRYALLPPFDPAGLAPRQRWETMLDVLDADRRLSAALGRQLGVDLLASPLPRMAIDDDRAVPAHRRNRLPRASVAQLPLGRWVEVGPYTAQEWAARGEVADGKGAYLRLNSTAYLVAVEHGDRATWRLEDTRTKVGAGRLDGGDEADLSAAKASAQATVARRYPQLVGPTPESAPTVATPGRNKWEPVGDGSRTLRHAHHGGIVAYVVAAGDLWIPMIQRSPDLAPEAVGSPLHDREDAMARSDEGGRRAVRQMHLPARVAFDDSIADLAASPTYRHDLLVERVSTRLATAEQQALAVHPSPAELVELLGAAGVTATTTVAVLHAEGVPAVVAGPLLPIVGIPPADAIGELTHRWGLSRVDAAELVDATPTEMRAAGCGAAEIIAARPREVVSVLPARPDLWDLAGGTLATTGRDAHDISGLLATHAPDADCFAAGLAAAVDEPADGIAAAVRHGMPAEAIVALSERYGLSPADTANALDQASAPSRLAVQVLYQRCDADTVLTTQLARSGLGLRTDAVIEALADNVPLDDTTVTELHNASRLSRDPHALITVNQPHRQPTAAASARPDVDLLLAALPAAEPGAAGARPSDLMHALPTPDATATKAGLLASLPQPEHPQLTEIDR